MSYSTISRMLLVGALGVALCLAGCSKKSVDDDVSDDGIAPSTVTDLTIANFTDTSVTLTWTASGDDSTSGTATSYDLRIAKAMIHWGNFDSASQASGLPAPKPAGESEQFEVKGLSPDSTYYFALMVKDETGNYEGVSNCVDATCFIDFVISIPDAGLLAAIRAQINKPTGNILKSDLIAMHDLLAEDGSISDLSGLEYCLNLLNLSIFGNAVSDLSPLAGLGKLVQLNAGQNGLSDLTPLANLHSLTGLGLRSNQIANLTPLVGLTQLESLDLQSNAIADISPLAGLNGLENLNLSYNRIRSITALVDNSGLGNGDDISLTQNPLNHESIKTQLPALRARGATVHWIDNSTPPAAVANLAVDTVSATTATLSWTAPGEDFSEGIAYRYEIRYSSTQSDLDSWTGGQVVANPPAPDSAGTVQSMLVSGLTEGTTYYFALRTQDNSENWSATSNVVWGKPYADAIVVFADAALETAIRSAIAKPSGDLHRSDLLALDTLIADNQGISDLTGIDQCVNLRLLQLSHGSISDLQPLAELPALHNLILYNNEITGISPLASITSLEVLQLDGNPLTDLSAVAGLANLRTLALSFVGNVDLQPVGSLTGLQFLFIAGNSLTDISPLSGCTNLTFIFADYNAIEDISALGGLLGLNSVSLNSNQVEDISPLVDNNGMGPGDQVALQNNPLSTESINTHIPALQLRGVTVTY